jgi:hypothetical protein
MQNDDVTMTAASGDKGPAVRDEGRGPALPCLCDLPIGERSPCQGRPDCPIPGIDAVMRRPALCACNGACLGRDDGGCRRPDTNGNLNGGRFVAWDMGARPAVSVDGRGAPGKAFGSFTGKPKSRK